MPSTLVRGAESSLLESVALRQPLAKTVKDSLQSFNEILPQKAIAVARKKSRTKPSIVDNPHLMECLEFAFTIGCTYKEAAALACCSERVIKLHVQQKTPVGYDATGEVLTFGDWIEMKRQIVCIKARLQIVRQMFRPAEEVGTADAWRWLESHSPQEWGRCCSRCYKRCARLYP